jgi:hypothetical protein
MTAPVQIREYPSVRASRWCPICEQRKPVSAIACWGCFNSFISEGMLPEIERVLEAAEMDLAPLAGRPWSKTVCDYVGECEREDVA